MAQSQRTLSLAVWHTQQGHAGTHTAQAGLPLPNTEPLFSPPGCSPNLSPAPEGLRNCLHSPRRRSCTGPSECLFVLQAVHFSCQGSKSSCPMLRIGQRCSHGGPHKWPQSTVGQARSAGSYKCYPDQASRRARAEPQSDLCVGQLVDSGCS